jgi:hypothetical protein
MSYFTDDELEDLEGLIRAAVERGEYDSSLDDYL